MANPKLKSCTPVIKWHLHICHDILRDLITTKPEFVFNWHKIPNLSCENYTFFLQPRLFLFFEFFFHIVIKYYFLKLCWPWQDRLQYSRHLYPVSWVWCFCNYHHGTFDIRNSFLSFFFSCFLSLFYSETPTHVWYYILDTESNSSHVREIVSYCYTVKTVNTGTHLTLIWLAALLAWMI